MLKYPKTTSIKALTSINQFNTYATNPTNTKIKTQSIQSNPAKNAKNTKTTKKNNKQNLQSKQAQAKCKSQTRNQEHKQISYTSNNSYKHKPIKPQQRAIQNVKQHV